MSERPTVAITHNKGHETMNTYIIDYDAHNHILNVKFGTPSDNSVITQDAHQRLLDLKANGTLKGGPLLRVNGPASLPVAFVIAHAVDHLYATIAVYDPKLTAYVVAVCHTSTHAIGQLVD